MNIVVHALLGSLLATALAGAAHAQPASAPAPARAASKANPAQSPAVAAAENAKEPGAQRPEERVVPQLSIPIKPRKGAVSPASAPGAGVPGGIDEAAARCRATRGAACERPAAASAPARSPR